MSRKMDLETAEALVDDDLPDGAYFAMLDELMGGEPGTAAEAMYERHLENERDAEEKPHVCSFCGGRFKKAAYLAQHLQARDSLCYKNRTRRRRR